MNRTGSDSPLQNGAVEVYKDKLAIRVCTLLYGSGLPAKYWSSALYYAVYLHNCLVHTVTRKTLIEGYFGFKPDIGHLKLFGSRICVKRSGNRSAKLDQNNFTGIFLGYPAMDQNICYLDLNTGIVKRCHHAQFDEVWYLQPNTPPAAQLLYDLGIEPDEAFYTEIGPLPLTVASNAQLPGTIKKILVPWPPLPPMTSPLCKHWPVLAAYTITPYPFVSPSPLLTPATKSLPPQHGFNPPHPSGVFPKSVAHLS
jgi:hypothetical protein